MSNFNSKNNSEKEIENSIENNPKNHDEEIQKLVSKLRHLRQYATKSDEEVLSIIEEKYDKKHNLDTTLGGDLSVDELFLEKEDKKIAKSFIRKYLEDYLIETISDKNTLKQLIQLEVLNLKLQNQVNQIYKGNKGGKEGPKVTLPQLIETLHKNIDQIRVLKNELGISRSQQASMQSDAYKAFEDFKKKLKVWGENNQGSRTISCAHCGKMLLLKIRTDKYDVQKHPFFVDRVLGNRHLLKMYKDNKITKEDVAQVLETSIFYIDWLLSVMKFKKESPIIDNPAQIIFDFNPTTNTITNSTTIEPSKEPSDILTAV